MFVISFYVCFITIKLKKKRLESVCSKLYITKHEATNMLAISCARKIKADSLFLFALILRAAKSIAIVY